MDQRRGSEGSSLRGIIHYYYSEIVTNRPASNRAVQIVSIKVFRRE